MSCGGLKKTSYEFNYISAIFKSNINVYTKENEENKNSE